MNSDEKPQKRKLEKMSDFFTARLDSYEEQMLKGGHEAYRQFAKLVPVNTAKILDLGCGTGLELDEIFRLLPLVEVVGIDITAPMLEKLKQKHPDKNIKLVCGSYFSLDLGENNFDAVISFETMHHFSHEEKVGLYRKIGKALRTEGVYLEGDYMVADKSVEDEMYAENTRLRRGQKIPDGELYHFDTPCTIDTQIALLKRAGFLSAVMVYRRENTTIIVAQKKADSINYPPEN
jgi:tRNA (cmo5U34)-methyltransferase